MEIPLFQVDAFTDRPFSGNPAAVCILAEDRDDRWMQAVAAEMKPAVTNEGSKIIQQVIVIRRDLKTPCHTSGRRSSPLAPVKP